MMNSNVYHTKIIYENKFKYNLHRYSRHVEPAISVKIIYEVLIIYSMKCLWWCYVLQKKKSKCAKPKLTYV